MKQSVKFIAGFCLNVWEARYRYWNWYINNWLEESIAVITSMIALC